MSDNQEPHVEWIKRKESIFKFQEEMAGAIITENTDRAGTLRALLACLQEFGNRQFAFFADKFDKVKSPTTPRHPLYAPEYFFDVTLSQIGYDTDVLLRAGQQRAIGLRVQIMLAQGAVVEANGRAAAQPLIGFAGGVGKA